MIHAIMLHRQGKGENCYLNLKLWCCITVVLQTADPMAVSHWLVPVGAETLARRRKDIVIPLHEGWLHSFLAHRGSYLDVIKR